MAAGRCFSFLAVGGGRRAALRRAAALGSRRVLGAAVCSRPLAAAGCLQPFSAGFAAIAAGAKYSNNNTQTRVPSFGLLALVAGGTITNVLSEPADCMGKRRKEGSVLEDDMYAVDYIKARRLVKGQPEYLIKWKGFDDDKYDTWEGLANLSGLEPDLATFEAQQKRDQEDYVK